MSALLFSVCMRRFSPNWTTVLAGWRGLGRRRDLVTPSDINQVALEKLSTTPDPSRSLVRLASVSEADSDQIDALLSSLASQEQTDHNAEVRKWIVCLLEKQLQELPADPLYGLLQLTEFWADLDFPNYSPHQIQGKGNELSPQDYYTEENYQRAIMRHRDWIKNELRNYRVGASLEDAADDGTEGAGLT